MVFIQYQMKKLLLLFGCLSVAYGIFCAAACASNSQANCSTTGPTSCTLCDPNYFSGGVCGPVMVNGLALIDYSNQINIPSLWTINTVNTNLTCIIEYASYANFSFNFYKKLVGGDSIYRTVPITTPHYQLKIKLSMAFIGVWGLSNDYILMHLYDTYQSYYQTLDYNCTATIVNQTQTICNTFTPNSYNGIDCLQNFEFAYNHNSSSIFINFTSISSEFDSTKQFWNLYDILIVVATCDVACQTCFGALPTQCFLCANNYYYEDNNTCLNTGCPGRYILPYDQNVLTSGQCVTACPQGYYLSGNHCFSCPSNCLACTSATDCTVSATSKANSTFKEHLTVWIIVIIIGVLLLVGIIWRLVCYTPSISAEGMRMIPEIGKRGSFQDRATINETMQPQQPQNVHIQQIDFKDNVMVDQYPRRRKRLEKDMNRTSVNF